MFFRFQAARDSRSLRKEVSIYRVAFLRKLLVRINNPDYVGARMRTGVCCCLYFYSHLHKPLRDGFLFVLALGSAYQSDAAFVHLNHVTIESEPVGEPELHKMPLFNP